MYFFTFHAVPDTQHPNSASIGGAFVNCWIDRATLAHAEAAARECIKDAGWRIDTLDDTQIVDRSNYDEASESLKYYEEAETDKQVFVFHIYPIGDATE
jgi:hypothetical protein